MIPALPPASTTDRRARLDAFREQARAIILARQDQHTGLLPASTAVTVHGDYSHAWVRDNVYSILAVWALALAYRRADPAQAAPLEDRVVTLMRGLLFSMMKQSPKVERFKHTQHPLDALHAKYDTQTGEPVVGDADWGHLQLDATAIFVLMLAQMSASGLRIVQSSDQASFVQNLVYYLAKAYRTADYGIWERGHKRNEGVAEINASSVGMAKAALEAASGLELMPGCAIYVAADDIANARNTLESLLPRESISKETDAALLSIVGFPAFAVEDAELMARTRTDVIEKLEGRYGCKRFLRDGHQTVVEDNSRLHYEPGELVRFEHIESEWPLFFAYLLIDAVLRGNADAAADYRSRLEGLLQERDGQHLLPELYFVPAESIEQERAEPHSQARLPNDNVPLVWAQSLYLVGVLLQEGYIEPMDLDPLGRQRAAAAGGACVQIALLAESDLVRSRLAAHGIACETLDEVHPVQVRYASVLEAALTELGRDAALGLSGRPVGRAGSLATGEAFTLGDQTIVFLPSFFDRHGFYLGLDNRLLADEIDAEVAYLRRHWRGSGDPLLVLWIAESMLESQGADVLLEHLAEIGRGSSDTVRIGPLAALLRQARSTRIDWLTELPPETLAFEPGAEADAMLAWEEAATRPLAPRRTALLERERDNSERLARLGRTRNPYEQIEVLGLLWRAHGPDFPTPLGGTVRQISEAVYARACRQRLWGVIRRAAGLLDVHDDMLEEAVARIVMRGKRVAVGRAYSANAVIGTPLANAEIFARLRAHGGEDPRGRVLIQEVLLLLGTLVKADPDLFEGTLTLRAWHLLLLLTAWLAREHGLSQAEAFDHLLDLSPHAILGRLREVIARGQEMANTLVRLQSLPHTGPIDALEHIGFSPTSDPVLPEDAAGWRAWREVTGVITGLPEDFYAQVWELLRHCQGLVIGDQLDFRNRLDSALSRSDMTAAEPGFALLVEDLLNKIQAPEYRQLTIEALLTLSHVSQANPELNFDGYLVIDVLVGIAVQLAWRHDRPGMQPADYNEHVAQAWSEFYASPPHRVANFVVAAVTRLLATAEA